MNTYDLYKSAVEALMQQLTEGSKSFKIKIELPDFEFNAVIRTDPDEDYNPFEEIHATVADEKLSVWITRPNEFSSTDWSDVESAFRIALIERLGNDFENVDIRDIAGYKYKFDAFSLSVAWLTGEIVDCESELERLRRTA